jgi:hypothetical protein
MTIKEKKQEIIDKMESIPDGEFSTGLFFQSVGSKYVHYMSIWEETTNEKMEIDEFYENYCY